MPAVLRDNATNAFTVHYNRRGLENADGLAAAQSLLMAQPANGPVTLESKLFSPAVVRFGSAIWSVSWGRGFAEYSFPGMSLIAVFLAVTGFPVGASVAAIGAVLASLIRNVVRSAEYRTSRLDWVGMAGWALLTGALIAVLKLTESSLFEAGFLGFTLTGLSLVSANQGSGVNFRLLSPLVISLTLIFGVIAGDSGWAVKILIASEIIRQLLQLPGALQNPAPHD